MNEAFVDTNVIIRLLTGDDPQKQQASLRVFQDVRDGRLILRTPITTIADAVYVLTSPRHYHKSRADAAALLAPLVKLPGFRVQSRRAVLRALDLFGTTPGLDFGDAIIAATMEQRRISDLYSYDDDFDGFAWVTRQEP
jgi:predicted nucleic acid-binding protein